MKRVLNIISLLCFLPLLAIGQLREGLDLDNDIVGIGWVEYVDAYNMYGEPAEPRAIFHGVGQGSIISWKGETFILIAGHSVEGAKEWSEIERYKDIPFVVKNRYRVAYAHFVYTNYGERDLALLQVDDPSFYEGSVPLEIKEQDINVGDKVYSVITPFGRNFRNVAFDLDIREGRVTAKGWLGEMDNNDIKESRGYVIDCPTMSGYSGSVVLSPDGRVVGVLTGALSSKGPNLKGAFVGCYGGVVSDSGFVEALPELKLFFQNFSQSK